VLVAPYRDPGYHLQPHRSVENPRDELSGTKDGTDVLFLRTTVDDRDHFQQILAWALKSRWEEQNQSLREITGTFRNEK